MIKKFGLLVKVNDVFLVTQAIHPGNFVKIRSQLFELSGGMGGARNLKLREGNVGARVRAQGSREIGVSG